MNVSWAAPEEPVGLGELDELAATPPETLGVPCVGRAVAMAPTPPVVGPLSESCAADGRKRKFESETRRGTYRGLGGTDGHRGTLEGREATVGTPAGGVDDTARRC